MDSRSGSAFDASRWWIVVGVLSVVNLIVIVWPRQPLWLDEAQSVAIARRSLPGIVDGLRADGAPPIYYLLLHLWMAVFGDGDVAVRSLSIMCGLAAVGVMAVVARDVLGRVAAPTLVLIAISHPYFARYATETRMYALVMLEVALGALALIRWQRTGRLSWLLALAAAAFALPLTHYWGLVLVLVGAASIVVVALIDGDRMARPTAALAAGACGVGLVATAFWWPVLRFQSQRTGTPWTRPSGLREALTATINRGIEDGPAAHLHMLMFGLLSAAGLLAGITLVRGHIRRDTDERRSTAPLRNSIALFGIVFAVTWLLSYAMTRATSSAFAARYTMTMFPLQLILVVAGALVFVPRRLLPVLTVAIWLAGTAVSISQIDAQRTRAPRFADVLESESDPADVVVYCPDQLGPPLSRLLDKRGVDLDGQFVFPTFGASDRVDWIDYRERHERASTTAFATEAVRRADGHAIWLVVSVTHRPTEAACAGLIDALRALRPEFEVAVPDDPSWREHDYLLRFGVPEPAAAP